MIVGIFLIFFLIPYHLGNPLYSYQDGGPELDASHEQLDQFGRSAGRGWAMGNQGRNGYQGINGDHDADSDTGFHLRSYFSNNGGSKLDKLSKAARMVGKTAHVVSTVADALKSVTDEQYPGMISNGRYQGGNGIGQQYKTNPMAVHIPFIPLATMHIPQNPSIHQSNGIPTQQDYLLNHPLLGGQSAFAPGILPHQTGAARNLFGMNGVHDGSPFGTPVGNHLTQDGNIMNSLGTHIGQHPNFGLTSSPYGAPTSQQAMLTSNPFGAPTSQLSPFGTASQLGMHSTGQMNPHYLQQASPYMSHQFTTPNIGHPMSGGNVMGQPYPNPIPAN